MPSIHYHQLLPTLPVKDVQASIHFFVETLGFENPWTYGNPVTDGGCSRNGAKVLFWQNAQQAEQCKGLGLILLVDGLDELYSHFMQKQIQFAAIQHNLQFGLKEFDITDVNGYYIRFIEQQDFHQKTR